MAALSLSSLFWLYPPAALRIQATARKRKGGIGEQQHLKYKRISLRMTTLGPSLGKRGVKLDYLSYMYSSQLFIVDGKAGMSGPPITIARSPL